MVATIEKLTAAVLVGCLAILVGAGTADARRCTPEEAALTESDVAPVVAARCPCDSQEAGEAWKNHGRYVSCVNRNTNQLFKQNDIARSCKRIIKKCASRSTCGKEGAVRCCISREKPCVGDPIPGDLVAEGVCHHDATIVCDTEADCVQTRCKIARYAERCEDKGGVVSGVGSCCGACTP